MNRRACWLLASVAVLSLAGERGALAASPESVLWSFGSAGDGFDPRADLITDRLGNLYGTTFAGGAAGNYGTVFELSPPAPGKTQWNERLLWSFTAGADGGGPLASLIADKRGNLYGTTTYGGLGHGVVFELSPPAPGGTQWSEHVLYTFSGGSDGGFPAAGVIMDGRGNLYGTTAEGGYGYGVVFALMPPRLGATQWSEQVLYAFSGGADGNFPGVGSLAADDRGNLYGTTEYGGVGHGVVFQVTPPAFGGASWKERVLWNFTGGADGGLPFSGVILDQRGSVYGTANGGGTGNGVVFALTPPKPWETRWSEAVLWNFQGGADGAGPVGGLLADQSGNLYGTTAEGGKVYDSGTVFEVAPPPRGKAQWSERVLWSFEGAPVDGASPWSGLIDDRHGNLYGATTEGGENDTGTVFRVSH